MIFPPRQVLPGGYNVLMAACMKGGLDPKIAVESSNKDVTANFVSEGMAISFAMPSLLQRPSASGLTLLDVEDLDCPLHLSALWLQHRETPAVTKFVDLLEQFVGSTP